MSAAFFERPGWQGEPGLHALVVGISAYPNLPVSSDLLKPEHFDMIQLASPALTAFRIATLLKDRGPQLGVPLATCRLLLAPSEAELAVEPALGGFAVPDWINFSAEAKAWREAAIADPHGMTLFYFAGHGLQRIKRDHVLVLSNFNDSVGGSLASKGVNVDHLFDGMAASEGQESIARTQWYFFDTCRIQPEVFKQHEIMGVGSFWDIKTVPAKEERLLPSFFASKPGGLAFAKPGRETLFGGALLKCLEGGAGVPANETDLEGPDWVVSLASLPKALKRHIDLANRDEEGAQEMLAQNLDGDFVLLRLEGPPDVAVSLAIDPEPAAAVARVSVVDADNSLRDFIPFDPNPFQTKLPAGVLRIRVIVEPAEPKLHPRLQKLFFILPPAVPLPLGLSRE